MSISADGYPLPGTPSDTPRDEADVLDREPPAEDDVLPDGSPMVEHEEKDTMAEEKSVYGKPESREKLAELLPPGPGGLIWHAELVSDEWFSPADCFEDGRIKPRRAILPVRAADFFASLVCTEDGRWIFSGVLNGWPGLTCLELRSITLKNGRSAITRFWDAENNPSGEAPAFPADGRKTVRATLRMAPWSSRGWSPEFRGSVWWCLAQLSEGPVMAYGDDIVSAVTKEAAAPGDGRIRSRSACGQIEVACADMPQAVRAHLFSHRYARGGKKPESTKERNTYHSLVLLEWDHGRYTTVVELATLNGVGGRRGKSNWYHDKLVQGAMPLEMIVPWKGHFAEIRCADVPAKNAKEFELYLKEYEGPTLRFVDPHWTHSGDVRLMYRSKVDIVRYLINYMGRDRRYTEEFRNCQSFAADFYSFVAAKKDIKPYHVAMRAVYQNRAHLFIYNPDMFEMPSVKDS